MTSALAAPKFAERDLFATNDAKAESRPAYQAKPGLFVRLLLRQPQ
jgi:hypothetical protein